MGRRTPDFFEAKNRLFKTLDPRALQFDPFFPPGVQAALGKSPCVVPDKAPRLPSEWCFSVVPMSESFIKLKVSFFLLL